MVWRRARKGLRRTKRPRFIRRFRKGYRPKMVSSGRRKYFFKRTLSVTQAVTDVWAPLNFTSQFLLSGFPNYTEFTNLYDEYKICAFKLKFIFDKSSSEAGSAINNIMPNLITVNDYNSSGASLTSESVALQYQTFKAKRLDRPVTRYFKPRILGTAIDNTGATINAPQFNQWLSTATGASTKYMGLLGAIDGSMSGGTGTNTLGYIKIFITAYIACRDVN